MVDHDGIAEPELLERGDILVFLRLPECHEGNLDGCRDAGFRVRPDIALGATAQLFFGGPLHEIRAHIHWGNHAVDVVVLVIRIDDLFRQRDQCFFFLVIESDPEGHDAGPDVAGIGGLLDVGQILSIPDHHACVDSPAGMELHREAVPLELTGTVNVQNRSGHTAKE